VSFTALRRPSSSLRHPFQSLAVPNYRRYFVGQVISISGNWMQTVGEMWLVLRLTNSATAVGLTAALQFTPMLFAGAWGGLLADRLSKRRLLAYTQSLMALPALTLWLLTTTGHVTLLVVYALVFVRGAVNAVDNPARQAFVMELVGRERVVNAVSLNSLIVQSARIIGPALAGIVIASAGIAPCFLLNSLSFGAMLIALWRIDPHELQPTRRSPRERGQLRDAIAHVRDTPELRVPLVVMSVVGTLSFNFQVILPLMARFAFGGGAATYAALTTAMAVGAVGGALAVGARRRIKPALLAAAALAFGGFSLAAAGAPTLATELVVLAGVGAASVTFSAGMNSSLQLAAAPEMRGRVMALYSVVFLGSTPIGAPITGWLAGAMGPRGPLVLAGIAALAGGVVLWAGLIRRPVAAPSAQPGRAVAAPSAQPASPAAVAASVQLHDAPDLVEPVDEPLQVARRVVHGERRTRRRRYAELAHQRLRTVVAGADADALPPEDLTDVVRMRPLERERHERAPVRRGKRAVHD
jgi:MFS family permease